MCKFEYFHNTHTYTHTPIARWRWATLTLGTNDSYGRTNECVSPCGMKRIISSLVNGQNTDHTEGTQKSVFIIIFFNNILGISAKRPVNWNIFIYQGNKRAATRPHFMRATVATRLTRKMLSSAALKAGLRAASCLLPFEHHRLWFWKAWGQRVGKTDMSEDLGTLLGFAAGLSFLKGNSMEYRHMDRL